MSLSPGTRLGRYEVVALLGAGGMGEVYRAHDLTLGRDVALKVLPEAVAADPHRVARFEREARAVAALSDPHILSIHDFGDDNGVRYAVTELLHGNTLREVLDEGPMPAPRSLAVILQIAEGLEAAHARGIVHRDLKPENVFVLDDGHVKILDFGLAKTGAQADTAAQTVVSGAGTEAGQVLGTAGYMSPEQIRGDAMDHRTDIFSLGCVMYELLAGRRPFQGDSAIDTMHATLHAAPDVAFISRLSPPLARTSIVVSTRNLSTVSNLPPTCDSRSRASRTAPALMSLVRESGNHRRPLDVPSPQSRSLLSQRWVPPCGTGRDRAGRTRRLRQPSHRLMVLRCCRSTILASRTAITSRPA